MPTTPKHTKDSKESFFPAAPATLHATSVNPDAVTSENLLRLNDLHSKPKQASSSSALSSVPQPQEPNKDTEHLQSQSVETAPSMSYLARGKSVLKKMS